MLWMSRLAYSMEGARTPPIRDDEDRSLWMIGLKVLLFSTKDSTKPTAGANIIHFHMFLSSSPSLLPSSALSKRTSFDSFFQSESVSSIYSSSSSGDLLGTESGVHMVRSDSEELNQIFKAEPSVSISRKMSQRSAAKKEYLPPITLLRDGVPWEFVRHYNDGRLVIRKEYVSSQECSEVDRSENDRLVRKLAPLDEGKVSCDNEVTEEEDEEVELGDLEFNEELETVEKEEEKEHMDEEEEDVEKLSGDNDDDDNTDCVLEDSATCTSLSVHSSTKRSMELETLTDIERSVDLPKCFTYAGGILASNPFLVNLKALQSTNVFLGLASSAPLPPKSSEMLLVRV